MSLDRWSWAIFFPRWVLGLMFFMAGWFKVFHMGPVEHARQFFVGGYADTWIPLFLLWGLGTLIPVVELAAGGLLCLGYRRRESLIALGLILIAVTYGHLLKEPFYDATSHIFPRLVLLTFLLAAPAERDALTLDRWLAGRRAPPSGGGN